jgi:hypothetical protein
MNLREHAGTMIGWIASPLFAAIAGARGARVFHPEGVVLAAVVEPAGTGRQVRAIAERLRGPALVRFSTALWRHGKEWPDALGCAVRFRASAKPSAEPECDDQDLLFATIRTPLTTPLGPVGTHVHDFLANTYFATAPFDVLGFGRVKWRLVPERRGSRQGDRGGRLTAVVARGKATLRLEMRRTLRRGWVPVARIRLEHEVQVDQDRLRFSPFRDGRGIRPRGFVHALRHGAYRASQRAGHPRSAEPVWMTRSQVPATNVRVLPVRGRAH